MTEIKKNFTEVFVVENGKKVLRIPKETLSYRQITMTLLIHTIIRS